MNLARFPRRKYVETPTPLHAIPRFSEALGGPNIFIKRDDLLPGTEGGNKTRKLDFVVGDALEKGADTLITCGAIQSNHCRLTAFAAVKEGLSCRLVLEERVAGTYNPKASGNNFLYELLGVEAITVVPGGSDVKGTMQKVADEVSAKGGKPYLIPGGASNPIGATGYVACAEEILGQLFAQGLSIDHIIVPSGSAGTHAGMVTGFHGTNSQIPISGINVSRPRDTQETLVYDLVKETALRVGVKQEIPRDAVRCYDDYVGKAYSVPTDGMIEAVTLLARTEGILLDPVYSGKTMAGLIDLVRKGYFQKDQNVLFLHTGGSPALYAYLDTFQPTFKTPVNNTL
ncbi:MAG: D-cysteine desulfhydrase [SAR324 cluster bacterium]|nr:D-cysteine desulfhydrase [SAR324 cluster bacterium]